MPITKVFDVRDVGTKMTLVAVQLGYNYNEDELHATEHAGYGSDEETQRNYVVFYWPVDKDGSHDTYHWYGRRTEFCAVTFVKAFIEDLRHGEIIDVEWLLGETDYPKVGDRSQDWMQGALLGNAHCAAFSRRQQSDETSGAV